MVCLGSDVVVMRVRGMNKVLVMIIDCNVCYFYLDLKVGG